MISAFGVEHVSGISKMSNTELRHRKRVQAGLSTAGAVVGLSALGAKGVKVGTGKYLKPAAKAVKINTKIDNGVNNALVVGGGIGGAAGLNSASISRAESKKPHHIHKVDKPKVLQAGFRVYRGAKIGSHPVHYAKGTRDGIKAGQFSRKHLTGKGMDPNQLEFQALQASQRNSYRHGKGATARAAGNMHGYKVGATDSSEFKEMARRHRQHAVIGGAAASAVGIGASTNVAIKHKIKKVDTSALGSNQHKRQVQIAVPRVSPKQRRHAALAASTGMLAGAGLAAGGNKKKLAVGLIAGGSALSGYAASDPNDYIREKKVSKSAFGIAKADHLNLIRQRKREYTAANYDIIAAEQGRGKHPSRPIVPRTEHVARIKTAEEALHASMQEASIAGHSHQEIARAAKWPIKTVRSVIRKSAFGVDHDINKKHDRAKGATAGAVLGGAAGYGVNDMRRVVLHTDGLNHAATSKEHISSAIRQPLSDTDVKFHIIAAGEHKLAAETLGRRMNSTPRKAALIGGGAAIGAAIGSRRKVSKAFDPEARRHTQLGAAAGVSGSVAAISGASALKSGHKARGHFRAASGANLTTKGRLLEGLHLKGAAQTQHARKTAVGHGEMLQHIRAGNTAAHRARGKTGVALGAAAATGAIVHHSNNGAANYVGPYQPKAKYAQGAKKTVTQIKRRFS